MSVFHIGMLLLNLLWTFNLKENRILNEQWNEMKWNEKTNVYKHAIGKLVYDRF